MNYQETLNWLFNQLPVFQRDGAKAYKANLDNTLALDKAFGHPHRNFKTIHIAGTNGKGSTSHMVTSMLMEAGHKVGLYTSPHLKDFSERISINGSNISQQYVVDFVKGNQQLIQDVQPSFFEITVAMAFAYFADEQVDYAVIETGMGGRLDSTNIVTPTLTAITNISLDHTAFLGNTFEAIAKEKAGIIKPNIPVVIGRAQERVKEVFQNFVHKNSAPLIFAEDVFETESIGFTDRFQTIRLKGESTIDLQCSLKGLYQKENIRTAYLIGKELERQAVLTEDDIKNGIANIDVNVPLLGRWQTLSQSPRIICDTGHNEDGITQIVEQLQNESFDKLHIVWGMVSDKDGDAIVSLLPDDAEYYLCAPPINRAMDVSDLEKYFQKYGKLFQTYTTCGDALENAKKSCSSNDLIFIGGSTFTVAEFV